MKERARELTKANSLRECYNLWRWIANSQDKFNSWLEAKRSWPGWKRFRRQYRIVGPIEPHYCPACLYSRGVCQDCPLPILRDHKCYRTLSPYRRWKGFLQRGQRDEAREQAKVIMNDARRALYALERGKNAKPTRSMGN